MAIGCAASQSACYRFAVKLRDHRELLDGCLDRVLAALATHYAAMGENVAIDGSNMPAYANGQRYLSKNGPERARYSDPDASWGHRFAVGTLAAGSYYGYKLHAAVCTDTDIPLAWVVTTGKASETRHALPLLDDVKRRGFRVKTVVGDKGYDNDPFHTGCMDRGILPVTSLNKTGRVKRGENKPPCCEHGTWTFGGADLKRRATKWRCPTAECNPKSVWITADRLHPLIPRETERSKKL